MVALKSIESNCPAAVSAMLEDCSPVLVTAKDHVGGQTE